MTTYNTQSACPGAEHLPQASACIEQPRRLTDYDRALLAMRRDRAKGAAEGASMMLNDVLFHQLTPEARAKGRAYVKGLNDEAAVLREEHLIAERIASTERQEKREQEQAEWRATMGITDARLLIERTA